MDIQAAALGPVALLRLKESNYCKALDKTNVDRCLLGSNLPGKLRK
jgi:hypothetical protein